MLFIYDKKAKIIEPCKETNLKAHSLLERQDLEKWIENYPEMLGEDLLILTTEYDRFDKTSERLDLLALDKAKATMLAKDSSRRFCSGEKVLSISVFIKQIAPKTLSRILRGT